MTNASRDAAIYRIDPIEDRRWAALLEEHPDASIFHTGGWLLALKRTYGFEPVAYTTSRPGEPLQDCLVFCNVDSWLTGRRIVSLPFSDHCRPLVRNTTALTDLLTFVRDERNRTNRKFVEIRPLILNDSSLSVDPHFRNHESFCFHKIDLSRSIEDLFKAFHKSERYAVRRAAREGLVYKSGRSEFLLHEFYRLFAVTRKRHGLPPQPFKWFCNLVDCLGPNITIRVAHSNDVAIAAMITLSFKNTITYKYSCSDRRFNPLGATPFLCWKTIEEGKADGATAFDLGRSSLGNQGLIDFKSRLGGVQQELKYFRDEPVRSLATVNKLTNDGRRPFYKSLLPMIPQKVFMHAGAILYKHVG